MGGFEQIDTGGIDTGRPQSARVWNYWLGGKDYFAVDKQLGQRVAAAVPGIVARRGGGGHRRGAGGPGATRASTPTASTRRLRPRRRRVVEELLLGSGD